MPSGDDDLKKLLAREFPNIPEKYEVSMSSDLLKEAEKDWGPKCYPGFVACEPLPARADSGTGLSALRGVSNELIPLKVVFESRSIQGHHFPVGSTVYILPRSGKSMWTNPMKLNGVLFVRVPESEIVLYE